MLMSEEEGWGVSQQVESVRNRESTVNPPVLTERPRRTCSSISGSDHFFFFIVTLSKTKTKYMLTVCRNTGHVAFGNCLRKLSIPKIYPKGMLSDSMVCHVSHSRAVECMMWPVSCRCNKNTQE